MNNYPQDFENLWAIYPKRAGGNSKKKAYKVYSARMKERDVRNVFDKHNAILFGVGRYAAFCEATGKIGTEYVMQACTFFGPDEHYECDWAIPAGGNNEAHQQARKLSLTERAEAGAAAAIRALDKQDDGELVVEDGATIRPQVD